MDITITPAPLRGTIRAASSKSHTHRLLICAALADKGSLIVCPDIGDDIKATISCLQAIGAVINRTDTGFMVHPFSNPPTSANFFCGESGTTLRFMLPIAGALGINSTFKLGGRLPLRPIAPLTDIMNTMGCTVTSPDQNTIHCTGMLHPGHYSITGSVSSQFISGLLFAMSIMNGESKLIITENLQSKPYVDLTVNVLNLFGVKIQDFCVSGTLPLRSPGTLTVEGDWSNAAYFLAANALGSQVSVANLEIGSAQGDKRVVELIQQLNVNCSINAVDIPDLVPILAVLAAFKKGASFRNVQRLRLKESDRIEATIEMLKSLGIKTSCNDVNLTVYPGRFRQCNIDSKNDHRIAMSAAIAATVADGPVTIQNCQCVNKSYPAFWQDYRTLGGRYE